jgi:hypothetical protein
MIPHHVSYQLAILGLLWLCVIFHYLWPSRGALAPQPPAEPVPPPFKRQRSNEPKPFEGLTKKPPCAACEHAANHPQEPPPMRPDPMPPTHRRPCRFPVPLEKRSYWIPGSWHVRMSYTDAILCPNP